MVSRFAERAQAVEQGSGGNGLGAASASSSPEEPRRRRRRKSREKMEVATPSFGEWQEPEPGGR